MILPATHRAVLVAILFAAAKLPAQSPFQFPTANHALYDAGSDLKFIAPTTPDRS